MLAPAELWLDEIVTPKKKTHKNTPGVNIPYHW